MLELAIITIAFIFGFYIGFQDKGNNKFLVTYSYVGNKSYGFDNAFFTFNKKSFLTEDVVKFITSEIQKQHPEYKQIILLEIKELR